MTVHIIAARSKNNVIGRGSEIPWRVKGEQKLFKEITMNGTLIMGRITFESIGKPLPGRTTIIVTRNPAYHQANCIYIAGGGEIYQQALGLADVVHLTTINAEIEGDVLFPSFPTPDFKLIEEKQFESNIDYTYQKFERIK